MSVCCEQNVKRRQNASQPTLTSGRNADDICKNPCPMDVCSDSGAIKNFKGKVMHGQGRKRNSQEVKPAGRPSGQSDDPLATQPKRRECQCPICGMRLDSPSSLLAHTKKHPGKSLIEAANTQSGENSVEKRSFSLPWTCVGCTRVFQRTRNLVIEACPSTGEEIYKCTICKRYNIGNKSDAVNSQSVAVGIKPPKMTSVDVEQAELPFACSRCARRFAAEAEQSEHFTNVHMPYKCFLCGETFASKEVYLKLHRNTHSRPFKCESCGERFPREKQMEVTLSEKTGLIRYRCRKCRSRPMDCGLTIHRRSYGHVWHCSICNRRFHYHIKFQKHKCYPVSSNSHVRCEVCGKNFRTPNLLEQHQEVEALRLSGERPFVCSTCGAGFRTRKTLEKHEILRHKFNGPLACGFNAAESTKVKVFPQKKSS